MDRLEAMLIFATAAETGSLSAAGRKLRMPLPTISRKISELESQLKVRLLIRSTRKLGLTNAGQSYLVACRRILEEVGEAERVASGEYNAPRGELIVTAPIVYGRVHLLPVITEFMQAYPDIDVQLTLADRLLNVWDDHIDVALRVGQLADSSLIATRLGSIRHVVCASPGYLAKRGTPASPDELAGHDCITFSGLMAANIWTFGRSRSTPSVTVRSRLVVNTAEAAIDAAIAGVGLTRVLSYQVAHAVQSRALELVLRRFEPAPTPISIVSTGLHTVPLKVRAFLEFATPRLKSRLASAAPAIGAGAGGK